MEQGKICVATWNIRGLCDPNRKLIVRQWIKSLTTPPHILCIQEIKGDGFRLDVALRAIFHDYQLVVARPEQGRGGTALLVHPHLKIRAKGILDFGQAAWAQFTHQFGDFGVISIYATNLPRECAMLWHILKNQLPIDNLIFTGDYNMVEHKEDSTGTSTQIKGSELDSWRLLLNRFNLADAFFTAYKLDGAWYTRRGLHLGRLVQSRLD